MLVDLAELSALSARGPALYRSVDLDATAVVGEDATMIVLSSQPGRDIESRRVGRSLDALPPDQA